MLILTRKVDEIVCIGDDIEVMVVRVNSDGSVRLGIEAPRDIRISRDVPIGQQPHRVRAERAVKLPA